LAHPIPKSDELLIYIGTYRTEVAARRDYKIMHRLFRNGALANYEAAIVTREAAGKIHVSRYKMSTRVGVWIGGILGVIVGVFASPFIIVTALLGTAIGGVSGHRWRHLSRADITKLVEIIDQGMAAVLLVVGVPVLDQRLEEAELTPEAHVFKKIDAHTRDLMLAVRQASSQLL
jgi:uncharacterized membrane protein